MYTRTMDGIRRSTTNLKNTTQRGNQDSGNNLIEMVVCSWGGARVGVFHLG